MERPPSPAGSPAPSETAEVPELHFVAPLLGMEQLRRFALVRLDEESPLFSLQSLDDAATSLLVLAPTAVFPDYSPDLDGVTRAALGLAEGAQPLLLVVVNAAATVADSTANLLAPIAVNPETMAAAQVVLTGSGLPLHAALAA